MLYVWVEGPDDARFFTGVLDPLFKRSYPLIKVIEYARMKDVKIANYLKSIIATGDCYIFFTDFDNNVCVSSTKQQLINKKINLDNKKIIVVKNEIESWYLAGLNLRDSKHLKIKKLQCTDEITKEKFLKIMECAKFSSRIDFMNEIIKVYSIDHAQTKNTSFKYFYNKFMSKTSHNNNQESLQT